MLRYILHVIVLILFSCSAAATIIGGGVTGYGGGGSFVELSVPFSAPVTGDSSVGNNTFQNNNLYAFNEDQNIVISSPLTVDVGPNSLNEVLGTGTTVASHYVFFDPAGTVRIQGYVDFDARILGIITSTTRLAATDFLINNDVNYLNPGLRGLESGDIVWIDGTMDYRLRLDWTASTPGDYVRVLTERSVLAEVPEPGTVVMFGLGLLILGFQISKKRYSGILVRLKNR